MNTRSILPKYTVPPTPPIIHRRVALGQTPHGLVLFPHTSEPSDGPVSGVQVAWGVKGDVSAWNGQVEPSVELGGVLGIVRLWDNAYLLVFLPNEGKKIFPNQQDGTYCVNTLRGVYSIPLHPELAPGAIAQLQAVQKSLKPKSPRKGGLKWSFGLNLKPGPKEASELQALADEANDTDEGEGEGDDDDDDDDDYGDEDDDYEAGFERATGTETNGEADGTMGSMSRDGVVAPEADEDPMPAMEYKKRFSWNKLLPVRRAKGPSASSAKDPQSTTGETTGAGSGAEAEASMDNSRPSTASSTLDSASGDKPFPADPPQRRDLETKIIRQIVREFSSGGFFYSHNYDLTHSLQFKRTKVSSRHHAESALASLLNHSPPTSPLETGPAQPPPVSPGSDEVVEPDVHLPLWRRADKRFFWNEWLIKDFIDKGFHNYIVPVTQGWVQSAEFVVDNVPIDFVVISRRSRDRAGLRYQRRGIDDEGHVANFVETEMIVRAKVENRVSMFSFVQIRGSIPLKWSQSPYSMKPPPVLDRPVDQSYSVANLHFNELTKKYGPITIINLSEQSGKEAVVTNGYGDLVKHLERDDLTYVPFDFHAKCHGMKWENISELVEEVDFAKMGYFWSLSNEPLREQTGVFRTNCIDCLDRTNVVQSALARHVLTEMLTQLGLVPAASDIESVFNDVWANNGDMLSLCYAHTSALKGDFVRTGKRDIQGMLNDGISSLSRMFYGAISDFFAQAVISFFLGHRNLGVFSEFLESLESSDVSNLAQLSRVRAAAIETASARVINEDERRRAGWVLLAPDERGVTLSAKLEEKILILTNRAVYVVSFNYSLDKVAEFSRIPLGSITSLRHGAYIISALQEAGRDPNENSGFIITFTTGSEVTRYSSYSLRNAEQSKNAPAEAEVHLEDDLKKAEAVGNGDTQFYAFKVLPMEFDEKNEEPRFDLPVEERKDGQGAAEETSDEEDIMEPVTPGPGKATTCKEQAGKIVRKIRRSCIRAGNDLGGIEEKDVVSLEEAERSTGLFAKMDYAVKRFLWL